MMVQRNDLVKTLLEKRTHHPRSLCDVHPWSPSALNIERQIDSWHQNSRVRSASPHVVNYWPSNMNRTEEPKATTLPMLYERIRFFILSFQHHQGSMGFSFPLISFWILMSRSHSYLCIISSPQPGPTAPGPDWTSSECSALLTGSTLYWM